MNESRAKKISIDLPSGLCATTGSISDPTFVADCTICLGLPKVGLFVFPGKRFAGEIWIADIGIPAVSTASVNAAHFLVTSGLAATLIPERDDGMHKGDAGSMIILAGSDEYHGAGVMSSYGAMRSGAGIVTLGMPDCLRSNLACTVLPEVITRFFPAADGGFAVSDELADRLSAQYRVMLAGPGWGRSESRAASARALLSKWRGVAVLDADFLNLITDTAVLRESPARLVLTPHIGEMARLCRLTIDEIRQNPVETARKFAVDNGLVLVLKSAITLIAEPRGRVYINSRPNSGLARGGSGDLLAGLIAGLATTGISELNAAVAGVFLLSEAAELARGELGADAMTISETASYLPRAFRTLRGDLPASQP